MDLHPALRRLADAYGIATEFWDWQGRHVEVPAETIAQVLAALGVDASHPGGGRAGAARAQDDAPWRADAAAVPGDPARAGRPSVDVHVRHGEPVSVWIELEGGGVRSNLRPAGELVASPTISTTG